MLCIISQVNRKLLHVICRMDDFRTMDKGHQFVTDRGHSLQMSMLSELARHKFDEHYHQPITHSSDGPTLESWVVVSGAVAVTFFDTDCRKLQRVELKAGDSFITFAGGHGFEILEDDTFVYEFKTGPYLGKELTKTYIKGNKHA